jgi:hypothetical protein
MTLLLPVAAFHYDTAVIASFWFLYRWSLKRAGAAAVIKEKNSSEMRQTRTIERLLRRQAKLEKRAKRREERREGKRKGLALQNDSTSRNFLASDF